MKVCLSWLIRRWSHYFTWVFLYIPGGCLGFLPSTDRIKLLNTWHLAKLTIKRNIFFRQKPTWGYVIRNVGNRWGSKTLRFFCKTPIQSSIEDGCVGYKVFRPLGFLGSSKFTAIFADTVRKYLMFEGRFWRTRERSRWDHLDGVTRVNNMLLIHTRLRQPVNHFFVPS